MGANRRLAMGFGLIAAIFLFIQISAISLVEPFVEGGLQPVENPQDPTNPLFYIAVILVVTAGMLVAFKYDVGGLIRVAIIGSGAWISTYVFDVWLPSPFEVASFGVTALLAAALLGIVMYAHPEWYVIDIAGALMGAAAAGLFGITFGIFPALVLLSILAIYDAISVYRTEHMLTLASGVMDLKVPVVLVIPMAPNYTFKDASLPDPNEDEDGGALDQSMPAEDGEDNPKRDDSDVCEGEDVEGDDDTDDAVDDGEDESDEDEGPLDRDALFIGLGDAIIPSILVASATYFAPSDVSMFYGVPLPAIAAMIGTFIGLAVLLRMVIAGRAHAGLPLLNGGSIGGYLVGALASGIPIVEALGLAPYF